MNYLIQKKYKDAIRNQVHCEKLSILDFMDYLNEKKDFSDGSFIVADGAYSGEENSRLASEHNLKIASMIRAMSVPLHIFG